MDRQSRRGRTANRPRTTAQKGSGANARRRNRIITRRNRRLGPIRNRLQRAQNNQNRNRRVRSNRRFRRFNNFNRNRNFQRRIIYIGGLPNYITNRGLFRLFRPEGRIIEYSVVRNRAGYSRGFGFIEFVRPRDAWRSIQKWNNTTLGVIDYLKEAREAASKFAEILRNEVVQSITAINENFKKTSDQINQTKADAKDMMDVLNGEIAKNSQLNE